LDLLLTAAASAEGRSAASVGDFQGKPVRFPTGNASDSPALGSFWPDHLFSGDRGRLAIHVLSGRRNGGIVDHRHARTTSTRSEAGGRRWRKVAADVRRLSKRAEARGQKSAHNAVGRFPKPGNAELLAGPARSPSAREARKGWAALSALRLGVPWVSLRLSAPDPIGPDSLSGQARSRLQFPARWEPPAAGPVPDFNSSIPAFQPLSA